MQVDKGSVNTVGMENALLSGSGRMEANCSYLQEILQTILLA